MKQRVTRRAWYDAGGFANGACFRRHNGRHWIYYILTGV
jgi:hypothetical protein